MSASKEDPRKSIYPSKPKKEINYFVVFGDSLSDGKNMGEKFSFLGSWVKGLWLKALGLDKSPKERFTNGYTWADNLRSSLISKFLNDDKIKKDSAQRFGKYNLNNADISDDILYQFHTQQKKYTMKEVIAEANEVKRKKRVQDREEGHLFAAKLENTPETVENPRHIVDCTDVADIAISHRYKTNAQRTTVRKKMGLLQARVKESSDDVSDQVITDSRYSKYVQEYYSLDNGRTAQYNGRNFFANYSQGGATSYDYSWKGIFLSLLSPFTSIKFFFTRLIVSNLSKQVEQFLEDNEKQEVSIEQKEKTLITVFSGANDLITANSEPSEDAANLAVQANIDNIEKLIKQGYRNFVLCNLPDLSLTPRYQNKSREERERAQKISQYFNTRLKDKYEKLKDKYPESSMDLFDINAVFCKVYVDVRDNGEKSEYAKYFDPKKLKEPYIDSPDYIITPERTSPGSKHMFWDDVHPTATMHALLLSEFYKSKEILGKYKLSAPSEQSAEQLCEKFKQKYHEKLEDNWFLSSNKELPIKYKEPAKALITILRYALNEHNKKGDFIREAMIDLGWWVNDEPNMCIPALSDAMWIVDPKQAEKIEAQLDPHLAKPDSPRMMLRALKGEVPDKKPLQKTIPPELALDPEVEKKLEKMLKKNQESSHKKTVLSPTFKKQESSTTETLTL